MKLETKKLRLALAHARGTLTVIASIRKPLLADYDYWFASGREKAAETCAEDTRAAREALVEIEKILEGK